MALRAVFAVYGGLKDGNQDDTQAADVTAALQEQFSLHPNGVVEIKNENLGGDPAKGVLKHFAAIVEVDGRRTPFACEEGQKIDFS